MCYFCNVSIVRILLWSVCLGPRNFDSPVSACYYCIWCVGIASRRYIHHFQNKWRKKETQTRSSCSTTHDDRKKRREKKLKRLTNSIFYRSNSVWVFSSYTNIFSLLYFCSLLFLLLFFPAFIKVLSAHYTT